ncbi:hypothetical protein [Methyloferula stellata]|uniref:hypothetical protein n=1 Tax=Methyloferula stellata TaxID=876270 RepID=UPI000379675E|nr:hypothetical protein [Methyloferula stellata]
MALGPFEFATSTKEGVTLLARDEPMVVHAQIPTDVLNDYFKLTGDGTNHQRQKLVIDNLDAFGKIAAGKYERGELKYRDGQGTTVAMVRLSLFDLECSTHISRDPSHSRLH